MILIIGGLGFVGSNVARAFLETGEDCILTQHKNARVPNFLKEQVGKRIFIEPVDAVDLNSLLAIGVRYPVTGIADLVTGGMPSGLTPVELAADILATVTGIANVLQAAQEWNVKRVSIAGAPVVYNGVSALPWREDQPLSLTAAFPIEAAKKCAEIVSSYISLMTHVDCIELRLPAMYGPNYDAARGSLVGRLVHAAVKGVPPNLEGLRGSIYAADGGDQCYIKDASRAIALLHTADKLNHTVYNIATGRPTTNQEIVNAIQKTIPAFKIDLPVAIPANPDSSWYMDITRLRQDTGFEPAYDIEKGVADYIAWLRAGNDR